MKTTLGHLPKHKKDELKTVVEVIRSIADVEMVILFGSYARGEQVEDEYQEGHITYTYQSDYDILIVFADNKEAGNIGLKNKIEDRLWKAPISTPVSVIMHGIKFFNDKIEKGNYFFTDIKKEGIKLYDSGNYKLPRRRKLDPAERKAHAIEDYEHWYSSANGFLKMYQSALQEGENNIAAFQLHQATERYYHAVLLVFTGYKPKLHNIEILGRKACNLQPEFCKAFPNSSEEEKRLFGLLKDAYVDARYKKDYKITKDELTYLSKCVEKLQQLTQELCKKYIDNITVAEK